MAMERKDTLFSKHKILDLAQDLPTQLKEVQGSFNKMMEDFNRLPNHMDYLSMVVDAKIKGEDPKTIDYISLHTQLENNLAKLLTLASEKNDLKEAARTRKATIRTGSVKDEIEKQVPQQILQQMIDDLTAMYKKYNDHMLPILSTAIRTYIKMENYSEAELGTYKYNKEFAEAKLDIKGKELRDLFSSVLQERDNLVKAAGLFNTLLNNFYKMDKGLSETKIEPKRSL